MEIAELSDLLVWAAATTFAVAMIAFAIDLGRRTDERLEARTEARATVGAGAPGAVAAPDGAGPAADVGHGGPARRRAAGIGLSTSWLGTAMLGVAILLRGLAAGRTPWANMYEFTLVGSFVAMVVFLVWNLRRDVRFLGAFVTGLVTLFVVVGLNSFHVAATGVQPALQNYWLVIHVGVAITATGIFTVAFVLSVLQLLRDARETGSPFLTRPGFRWLDRMPAPAALESMSFRLNAVGFVMWTFTIIGGAIWAEDAWGRYWGWDPKEVWSFIIWVVYAAYLHARTTRGWSGRRAAWFVVVGYACVLFNFTGVNLIFNGKHSYSGIS
ncbi:MULTISPECIES: c-type cytochrome biogenesis protein CcsB [unclassified Isoptericola]|uniref:c-type cytochrome biogenesis protein CcsB n=1 Tax=unclassified Isoptericola TaxID=2623355 RepID=UPI002713BC82|nr:MULTISPECIES: c-type cytochrome biogenesis protein CcsB [unclassified Isoptericola]MDO8147114.1 c-type cytochrome biogenesis protein CcsB [Isoptericola sp. b515]MDO8150571.1 c-type cytochrome biogenesis protein CcsB [Isoptericola sp. b408]